ncbi:tryptophan 5-hydroxylase 1, partial [Brachionus plicatilis]
MDFDRSLYFRFMDVGLKQLNTVSEEMDDADVVKAVNEKSPKDLPKMHNESFIFTLKNRVGGLARALRVFEESGLNVVHIESRKSLRTNSEYEI